MCGPISTGGFGSIKANLNSFNDAIINLQSKNLNVFDQMPFEIPMKNLKYKLSGGEYMEDILTNFYLPIFESGRIQELYFLPHWQSSHGSNWEHEQAKRLGIKITYL